MTIFALSTGSVTSGISIIRITGNETKNIIKKLTKNNSPIPVKQPYQISMILITMK